MLRKLIGKLFKLFAPSPRHSKKNEFCTHILEWRNNSYQNWRKWDMNNFNMITLFCPLFLFLLVLYRQCCFSLFSLFVDFFSLATWLCKPFLLWHTSCKTKRKASIKKNQSQKDIIINLLILNTPPTVCPFPNISILRNFCTFDESVINFHKLSSVIFSPH